MRCLAACIRQLKTAGPLPEREVEEGRRLAEELKAVVPDPYTALTDEEREGIVRAISLPTGSWYACPRGQLLRDGCRDFPQHLYPLLHY